MPIPSPAARRAEADRLAAFLGQFDFAAPMALLDLSVAADRQIGPTADAALLRAIRAAGLSLRTVGKVTYVRRPS